MNRREKDILRNIVLDKYISQRSLSEMNGCSLGLVNKSIRNLISEGYLDENMQVTLKAKKLMESCKPRNAVILAAGFGMRMVPINMETPKALLEVNKEVIIERIIKQLQEAGIREITVVVGFMKEKFEYLIDEFDINLVINSEYTSKNNLHSLNLVVDSIEDTYVIPGDIWCKENPFSCHELYSWYMVGDSLDADSNVRINRKKELSFIDKEAKGNHMLGIAYIKDDDALVIKKRVKEMCKQTYFDNSFWEECLYEKNKLMIVAREVSSKDVVEINTYEQLRELDGDSLNLKSDAIAIAADILQTDMKEIKEITVLKKGMTNRSFLFKCKDKKYIMRIPGEGTEQLIDRKREAEVYSAIAGKNICDEIIYMNSQNGYKITEFIENARACDSLNEADLKSCMEFLREFHCRKIQVEHEFDIWEKIEFYEKLRGDGGSVYRDYEKVKSNILALKKYIDSFEIEKVLTHIDAVPDNFLFAEDRKEIRLIDWEYAGMQDPHVDIAMFCIYSLYDRESVDKLIDIYFMGTCSEEIRTKIYCYIAMCGLLWSNWCEYKSKLGVEFGEYSIRQYRYAKEYYKLVRQRLDGEQKNN